MPSSAVPVPPGAGGRGGRRRFGIWLFASHIDAWCHNPRVLIPEVEPAGFSAADAQGGCSAQRQKHWRVVKAPLSPRSDGTHSQWDGHFVENGVFAAPARAPEARGGAPRCAGSTALGPLHRPSAASRAPAAAKTSCQSRPNARFRGCARYSTNLAPARRLADGPGRPMTPRRARASWPVHGGGCAGL